MRVVTIDGPAGAGKSTIARRLAERLGWHLLDTGAMFRAVTLAAIRRGVDLQDDDALGGLVASITVTLSSTRVFLDGEDVTGPIRTLEVTRQIGSVADSPRVRRRLVEWQRRFAASVASLITEGRDQGTIVFPDAYRKFYLTASDPERARRRHAELLARGESLTLERVLVDIRERDARDAARQIAPMRPAEDAMTVDTTGMDLDEVVALLEANVVESDEAGKAST